MNTTERSLNRSRRRSNNLRFMREERGFGDEVLFFRSEGEAERYQDAVDAFARTGDRPALLSNLLAVGVSGAQARWHIDHPGECLIWCH
jgi:hypothetical protein